MKKPIKIFISGKVTGLDYQLTCQKFQAAEDTILGAFPNCEVFNPVKIVPEGVSFAKSVDLLKPALANSDAFVMLPDWVDSTEAKIQFQYAKAKNRVVVGFENIEKIPACLNTSF